MQTLESLLKKGTTILKDNGLEEAGLDAWLLLEYTADIGRAWYYAHPETEAGEKTALKYLELCKQRAEHIPLQHMTDTLLGIAQSLDTTVDQLLYDNTPVLVSKFDADIKELTSDCSNQEKEFLLEIIKSTKTALRNYKPVK